MAPATNSVAKVKANIDRFMFMAFIVATRPEQVSAFQFGRY